MNKKQKIIMMSIKSKGSLLLTLAVALSVVAVIGYLNSRTTSKDQEAKQATRHLAPLHKYISKLLTESYKTDGRQNVTMSPESSHPTVVGPLYEFCGKLLTELNKRDGKQNIIMSPVSIHQALSMLLLGSDASSETRRQILDAIGYSNMNQSQIEHCHEDYARVVTDFERITKETPAKRRDSEGTKKRARSDWEVANSKPRSPVLDIFTMLVTKNKGQVKAGYAKDIEKYYHASISNIDDAKSETKSDLLKKMNGWAKKAGFEQPIMDKQYLDDEFDALLLTAIRVEAFWMDDFYERHEEKIFYNYGCMGKPVDGECLTASDQYGSRFLEFTTSENAKVKRLHTHMSQDKTFNQLSHFNFRAVQMPLRGNLSFVILEPLGGDASYTSPGGTTIPNLNILAADLFASSTGRDGATTNLAKVLELLDVEDNDNQINYFRMPKFKFESNIDLKSALQSIGLRRVFVEGQAEISNITENKLYVSDIKHKAVIEATKTGIKAAGVTMIKMGFVSGTYRIQPINVIIENPFIFVLRYQKMPIFVGQLTNL